MTLSYIYTIGNKSDTFDSKGIITDCLPHQANSNNQNQYLSPDYFLPSSSNSSYYSRKYSGSNNNHNLNHYFKYSKLLKVVSIGLLATSIEVQASPSIELQKEASSGNITGGTMSSIGGGVGGI